MDWGSHISLSLKHRLCVSLSYRNQGAHNWLFQSAYKLRNGLLTNFEKSKLQTGSFKVNDNKYQNHS